MADFEFAFFALFTKAHAASMRKLRSLQVHSEHLKGTKLNGSFAMHTLKKAGTYVSNFVL